MKLFVLIAACGTTTPKNNSAMLDAHNAVRAGVSVEPLAWDDKLATYAQQWADQLKSTTGDCDVRKLPTPHRPNPMYGENIAWYLGQLADESRVVGDWAGERADYDYASNSCAKVCGHYTQLVWRDTRRVGCGVTTCANQQIWVCNYDPPGNVIDHKPY